MAKSSDAGSHRRHSRGERTISSTLSEPSFAEVRASPRSMLSVDELSRRPTRDPDYEVESHALVALAQEMASSPDRILHKLAETALKLCGAHSAGFSLLEEADHKRRFHWRVIVGAWEHNLNGGTPRDFGPCGTVLDRNAPLICTRPEQDFPYWSEVKPVLEEGLLIPFYVNGEAIGTIWVIAHDGSRQFDREDLRLMTNLGAFTSAVYQTWLSVNAAQDARRAALNVMEDALQSRQAMEALTEQLRESEGRQRLLVNELNHRVKNMLATVQSIAAQTFRAGKLDSSVRENFEARLVALANAHSILAEESWEGAEIHDVLAQILEPHANPWRLRMQGPPVRLSPKAALAISMAMHELATNAAKYGALSNATGRIDLTWTFDAPNHGTLNLRWAETGGPVVSAPTRKGFGSRLIERNLDGVVKIDYRPEGVVCIIVISHE
jgi:two-component sensor histidine kinase